MLKRTTAVVIAVLIAVTAGPVAAQCTLGVYSDAEGSSSLVSPVQNVPFDVYVVLFTEGLANAVGYTLVIDGGPDLFVTGAVYGPGGGGLNFPNDPSQPLLSGARVGLGTCAVGFGGSPVVVAKYSALAIGEDIGPNGQASFAVTGNAQSSSLDPAFPSISDCVGELSSCGIGPALTIEMVVDNQVESFGAVKNLYRN